MRRAYGWSRTDQNDSYLTSVIPNLDYRSGSWLSAALGQTLAERIGPAITVLITDGEALQSKLLSKIMGEYHDPDAPDLEASIKCQMNLRPAAGLIRIRLSIGAKPNSQKRGPDWDWGGAQALRTWSRDESGDVSISSDFRSLLVPAMPMLLRSLDAQVGQFLNQAPIIFAGNLGSA